MAVTITFATDGSSKVFTLTPDNVVRVIAALEYLRLDGELSIYLFARWFQDQVVRVVHHHERREAERNVESDEEILE